jgi:hypothetical protein
MTDSLGRLGLRARGGLPTVEPLLPSRYAASEMRPAGWGEALVEAEAPGSAPPRPFHRNAPEARPSRFPEPQTRPVVEPVARAVPSRFDAAPMPEPSPDPEPSGLHQSMRRAAAQSRTAATTVDRGAQASVEDPGARSSAPPRAAAAEAPEPPAFTAQTASLTPAAEARPEAISPAPRSLGQATMMEAVPAVMPRSEAEGGAPARFAGPNVSITIGLVEIHAAPPRPAAVRPAPAPVRRAPVSLADYLARRSAKAP